MDSYYIKFERSGGFAGITQTLELKSDTLSAEDRDHLSKLIKSSAFFEHIEKSDSGMPDQFNYMITINSSKKDKTVKISDSSMPESLRPLVDHLTGLLRQR